MSQDKEILRRRMGEVASLPVDDPQRQETVRQILALGPEVEEEWLDLLRDDELIRLALGRADPPTGLEQMLRSIPDQAPSQRVGRFRGALWGSGIAAAIIVALTLWLMVGGRGNALSTGGAKDRLAAMASQLHGLSPALTLETSQPWRIESELDGYLPEPVRVPKLREGFQLVGAIPTMLDGHRVVITRWRCPEGHDCSVYQFCAQDFDLPPRLPREKLIAAAGPGKPRYQVVIWNEDHCAYAMVTQLIDSPLQGRPSEPV